MKDVFDYNKVKEDLFKIVDEIQIDQESSYIVSYRSILKHFQKNEFSMDDFVIGAHSVFGWMPTILDLKFNNHPDDDLQEGVNILKVVKETGEIKDEKLEFLRELVNQRYVGVSKLLHFVAPESFAIWDSKVCTFVFKKKTWVTNPNKYRKYHDILKGIKDSPDFEVFHEKMEEKVGYKISAYRAIELCMFQYIRNQGKGKGKKQL